VIKLLYKPFGILLSVVGGLAAGALFKQIWRAIAGEDETPDAKDRDRGWGEIIGAAAVEGAVFGGVKAAIDHAGAAGFERATGVWPGRTDDDD
jgi:Protein of unknown function (DUF4235)